jgi:hypothetical protein
VFHAVSHGQSCGRRRPTAITFTFDDRDDRLLRGVHLDVTGSYGTELRALCDHIRATVAALAMGFKLIESAQARWRAVNAPHLVALVRAGARFEKGTLVERPDESGGDQHVA